MAKMTPEEEATIALDRGVLRGHLRGAARQEYDRLLSERLERAQARPAASYEQESEEWQLDQSLNCRECGAELTLNARFCASCGEPANTGTQDMHCRQCGEQLTPNARFCASCGEPLNPRLAGRSLARNSVGQPTVSADKVLAEFTVKYVTFYDGSGHRLGPSECTLTSSRLIIYDARGGMHQILLRDISGVSTPSRMVAPKMLRIKLPTQAYDIDFTSREQKSNVEARLGEAIRGSIR